MDGLERASRPHMAGPCRGLGEFMMKGFLDDILPSTPASTKRAPAPLATIRRQLHTAATGMTGTPLVLLPWLSRIWILLYC